MCAINENVNVKIIKVVLKQLNWKMKKKLEENRLDVDIYTDNHK